MENNSSNTNSNKSKILIEIAIVLITMLSVKWLLDYFQINGAGTIGIWSGIIVATLFMRQRNFRWYDFGFKFPRGRRDWVANILFALLGVVLVFLIMGLILDPLLTKFGLEKPSNVADRFNFFLGKPLVFIGYLVTVVWFGAALGEELLMRGFLLNRLTDLIGKTKLGYTLSLIIHAVIFGMLHIYQGMAGVITTGFVAIIFGLIYFISKKRLFPVILAHIIINTISLTAFYITDGAVN